ncbi:hypothetical protein EZV62_022132 [Acer yangbiense]|uniref:Retrotransposon gag domain-containing protein n=1 Tax=Acer yangbiense TaxID=1000413 RepID=A0A5C7H7B4_9ROSI|nr:hypothetical protein EZV62_022132 [Acer yangbiense]
MASQMAQIQELLTAGHTRVDLEDTKGREKWILGSAPGSSNGSQRFQGQNNINHKVIYEPTLRPHKLTFPKFDGNDPKLWIRKCDRFEEIKPRMLDKNMGLSEELFLESFISGFKGEIKHFVKMFNPLDLKTAIHLARLQEASIEAKKTKTWLAKPDTYPTQNQPLSKQNTPTTQPLITYRNRKNTELIPIKRLIHVELIARRDKGLCYNCDEVYTFGHQCFKKQLYMLCGTEEEEEEIKGEEAVNTQEVEHGVVDEEMTISHHTLT